MRPFPPTSHQQRCLDNRPFPIPLPMCGGGWTLGILGVPFRDVVVCGMTGPGHCGEGWVFVLLQSGSQSGRPEREMV